MLDRIGDAGRGPDQRHHRLVEPAVGSPAPQLRNAAQDHPDIAQEPEGEPAQPPGDDGKRQQDGHEMPDIEIDGARFPGNARQHGRDEQESQFVHVITGGDAQDS